MLRGSEPYNSLVWAPVMRQKNCIANVWSWTLRICARCVTVKLSWRPHQLVPMTRFTIAMHVRCFHRFRSIGLIYYFSISFHRLSGWLSIQPFPRPLKLWLTPQTVLISFMGGHTHTSCVATRTFPGSPQHIRERACGTTYFWAWSDVLHLGIFILSVGEWWLRHSADTTGW
jgi:hypothetical protein